MPPLLPPAGNSSMGVGMGENATEAVRSNGWLGIIGFECSVELCCCGSGDESCTTSCQSHCKFRSRHRRHGFSSSHLSLEEAQALQAWETRLCFATEELLLRFRSRSWA